MSIFSSILKSIASLSGVGASDLNQGTPVAPASSSTPPPPSVTPESVPSEPVPPEPMASEPVSPEPVLQEPPPPEPANLDNGPSESEPSPPPTGRIYFQYARSKIASEDDLRDQIREWIRKELGRKSPRLVLEEEDQADPLAAVERVLLGDGAERTFLLSNCSTGGTRACWMAERGRCSLVDHDECCLKKLPCNTILIRPKKDIPSIARMFPGDEILAVRAYLYNCPEQSSGCVAAIAGYAWAPTCEPRPFERELRASFVSQEDATRNWELRGRPDNLLTTETLSGLPPISIETSNNLRSWTDYLDWRNRLVAENARTIRYLRAQRNHDGSVSFFVVHDGTGEAPNLSWLRREELEAVPLSASADSWTFREPEKDAHRPWQRVRATLLGEADSVKSISADNVPVPEDCPWGGLGIVEVRVDIAGENQPMRGEGKTSEDDGPMLELPKGVPETGFLRICQRGDKSLVDRMAKTIDDFARNGSVAAPFLSSYIFDISQARLPARSTPIDTFLNPHLSEDQKRAVQVMVDAPDIALVQGPPGTGKTTVIAEAIYQFAKAGKTVLLASQSIAAVENAFDKLEHVPEIRIQLRRKQSASGTADQEQEPYSDTEVLREYYATLGRKSSEAVSMIDQARERRARLLTAADELEPLVRRMDEESATEAVAAEEAVKASEGIRVAVIRAESADASRRAHEASERLWAALPSLAPTMLGDWARDVPNSVITPLADAIRKAANVLGEQGIRIWSDLGEDEPHRPADVRLRALAGAVERLRLLRDKGLPALLKCVDEWRATAGERLVDDESARIVQDLTIRLREAERRRDEADDAGNDEAAYQRFDAEARRLRREIREAKAAAKTSVGVFREWFTVPRGDGQTLADAIEAAHGNRAAILELVAGFESFARGFLNVVHGEEERVAAALRGATDALPEEDKGANVALRKARLALRDAETSAREAQERRRTFEEEAAPVFERIRSVEPGVPAEPSAALAWCRESAAEIERRTNAEREAHPWLEPLLREWAALTAAPNDEDLSRVLPLYLDSCNVVGTTCTSNPRLLGDRHFDVVIVDEVSKATPPELLAPMMRGSKAILVGDHRQLPPQFDEKEPLLFEELAQREEENADIPEERKIVGRNFRKYERMVENSLFKRHFEQAAPHLKSLLWKQYRMHPEIMDVINVFYEGKLRCGIPEGEADRVRDHGQSGKHVPWMSGRRHAYWIDSTTSPAGDFFSDEQAGTSRMNGLEAQLILRALKDLDAGLDGQFSPEGDPITKSAGVIAFYGKQKALLLREIRKLQLRHLTCRVETVDRFQGQQCDYVLVSMTRNSRYRNGGLRSFIARFERINVAFSRARELLLIFGARDFFRRQRVRLPSLDGSGHAKTINVYGDITDMLARRGTLLSSADVISASEWKALPPLQTGAKSKRFAPETAKRPATPARPPKNRPNFSGERKQRFHGPYRYQRTDRTGHRPPRHN